MIVALVLLEPRGTEERSCTFLFADGTERVWEFWQSSGSVLRSHKPSWPRVWEQLLRPWSAWDVIGSLPFIFWMWTQQHCWGTTMMFRLDAGQLETELVTQQHDLKAVQAETFSGVCSAVIMEANLCGSASLWICFFWQELHKDQTHNSPHWWTAEKSVRVAVLSPQTRAHYASFPTESMTVQSEVELKYWKNIIKWICLLKLRGIGWYV